MSEKRGPYLVGGTQSTDDETLATIAEDMAAAIREWEQAKRARESWEPVAGAMPPLGLLDNARKANRLLTEALRQYDDYTKNEMEEVEPKCVCPADGYSWICPVHGRHTPR